MEKINEGRLKVIYRNMPLKKALILTIILSILLAFMLSALVVVATRLTYYYLLTSKAGDTALQTHDTMTLSFIGLCICISIVTGIYIFYKNKIFNPLHALMKGTEQITQNNLDFTMLYESKDEFGILCKSFEKMRDELHFNHKTMWRMTEERKKLNAAFAHDLRTPLTVLRGYTDFLEEYIPSSEKNDEKLLETTRMMAQYIKRLEDYVYMMNTIQKLEDTPIQLQTISTETFVEMIQANIKLISLKMEKGFPFSMKYT